MKDGISNVTTDYSYDLTGRLVQSAQSGSRSGRSSYTYDNMDRVTMQHNFVNDYTQWMTYTYGDDGLLSHSSQHNMGTDFSYTYLNCVESETVKWNNQAVLTNHYGYVMDTQMVQSIQPVIGGVNQGYYSYGYDKAGNIRSVSKNGELLLQYWYDGLGQLTRVDDARQQKTFIYSYSDVGNLEYKAQASYTTTANLLGPPSNYVYYGYSDSEWPDLLTMYNGQSISYDMIGNPLSYRDGMTMSWQNGRQLASLQKGSSVVNYSYDVNGQRVKKTAGTDTVDFYYDDNGRLIKQEDDGGNIWFYYNPTGAAASMSYHGTHYYFLKNLQGDVVALVNMQGDIAARYVYDAWGDIVSVTDANGNAITDQNHVANRNPIRYRGYYYDTESGLYYLNSRYYDPVTGRFINLDGVMGVNHNMVTYNLFAYCGNNPVTRYDNTGLFWEDPIRGLLHAGNAWAISVGIDTAAIGAAILEMNVDSNGIYHAEFDCWQQYFGYNELYDIVFNIGTDMKSDHWDFTCEGRGYTIWAWKGDYINLGAGAELGIYSGASGHRLVDKDLAMKMSMILQYKGQMIIGHFPDEKQWWITGFNPNYLYVDASDLFVVFELEFNDSNMYNAFKNKYYKDERWWFWDNVQWAMLYF